MSPELAALLTDLRAHLRGTLTLYQSEYLSPSLQKLMRLPHLEDAQRKLLARLDRAIPKGGECES